MPIERSNTSQKFTKNRKYYSSFVEHAEHYKMLSSIPQVCENHASNTVVGFILLSVLLFSVFGCQKRNLIEKPKDESILATVNDEEITLSDFYLSENWLPQFVREMETGSTLKLNRFGALLQIYLLSQRAREENLLRAEERSLAVKEALAGLYLERESKKISIDDSDDILNSMINENPEAFSSEEKYIITYSLFHTKERADTMRYAYAMALGAQLSRNEETTPRAHFDIAFASRFTENKEIANTVGPFGASDNIALTCEHNIATLTSWQEGTVIIPNISCQEDWYSFAVFEKRIPKTQLSHADAMNLARQQLIEKEKRNRKAMLKAQVSTSEEIERLKTTLGLNL